MHKILEAVKTLRKSKNAKIMLILGIMVVAFMFVTLRDIIFPKLSSLTISDNVISDNFRDGDLDEYNVSKIENPSGALEIVWIQYWWGWAFDVKEKNESYQLLDPVGLLILELDITPMSIKLENVTIKAQPPDIDYMSYANADGEPYGAIIIVLEDTSGYTIACYFAYILGDISDNNNTLLYLQSHGITFDKIYYTTHPYADRAQSTIYLNDMITLKRIYIYIAVDNYDNASSLDYPPYYGDEIGSNSIQFYGIYFEKTSSLQITNPENGSRLTISNVNVEWQSSVYPDYYELRLDFGTWINVGLTNSYMLSVVDGVHNVSVRAVLGNEVIASNYSIFIVDTVNINIPQSVDAYGFNITLVYGIPLENNTFDIKLYCQGYEPQTTADLDPQYAYWFRYYANTSAIQNLGSHGFAEFKEKYVDSGSGLYYDTIFISLENISWAGTWEIKVIPSPYGYTKTKTFNINAYVYVGLDRTSIEYNIIPTTNTTIPIGFFTINITANTQFRLYLRASGNAIGENTSWEIPIEYFMFDLDGSLDGNEVNLSTSLVEVAYIDSLPYYNRTFTIYLYWRVVLPIPDDTYRFTIYIVVEVV